MAAFDAPAAADKVAEIRSEEPAFVTMAALPPVRPTEYGTADVREVLRRDRFTRRARYRAHWWFPLLLVLSALAGCWGLLRTDQWFAQELIWPTAGAQFVEVGPTPENPAAIGGKLIIVAGGLNQKSGTRVATALMPSLAADHARVFSLVYGSGINDKDLQDKYDALVSQLQPHRVSFFGSSMGGDVVLRLAAHAQELRSDYVTSLFALSTPPPTPDRHPAANVSGIAGLPSVIGDAGSSPDAESSPDASITGSSSGQTGLGGFFGFLTAGEGGATNLSPDTGVPVDSAASGEGNPSRAAGSAAGFNGTAAVNGGPSSGTTNVASNGTSNDAAAQDPASTSNSLSAAPPAPAPPPRIGTIYLDCSPLGADDVRNSSRTKADALTAVMEATGTEGGVAVRMTAEVLGQQDQWSTGRLPFLQVRTDDLVFKVKQVWQEKISAPGISTELIKDQYGVIRRTNIDDIVENLGPGTQIVYFLPENRHDDRTVRVEQVESTLTELAAAEQLDLRVVEIPGGSHASAADNADMYMSAIDAIRTGRT